MLFMICELLIFVLSNECEYELKDGLKYNFAKLRKQTGDYESWFRHGTYKANFCGPLNSKCITSPNTPAALFVSGKLKNLIRSMYKKILS